MGSDVALEVIEGRVSEVCEERIFILDGIDSLGEYTVEGVAAGDGAGDLAGLPECDSY